MRSFIQTIVNLGGKRYFLESIFGAILAFILGTLFMRSSILFLLLLVGCAGIYILFKNINAVFVALCALIFFIPWQAPGKAGWGLVTGRLFGIPVPFVDVLILLTLFLIAVYTFSYKPERMLTVPLIKPFIAFFLVAFISSAFSVEPGNSLHFLIFRFFIPSFSTFLISYWLCRDKISLSYILYALLCIGFIISVYAIFEYSFKLNPIELFFSRYFPSGEGRAAYFVKRTAFYRASATFGSPTFLGSFLIPIIFLNFVFLRYLKTRFIRFIFLFFLIINLIALTFAASRGAILGFIISCIIFFCMTKTNTKKTLLLVGIPVLLISILFTSWYGLESTKGRFIPEYILSSAAFLERIEAYKIWLDFFKLNPFFGVGAFNYSKMYATLYSGVPSLSTMDNTFLFILSSCGIIGFIAFLYLLRRLLKLTYIAHRRLKEYDVSLVLLSIFSALIGMLVSFIFYNSVGYLAPSFMFWSLAGIGVAVFQNPGSFKEDQREDLNT